MDSWRLQKKRILHSLQTWVCFDISLTQFMYTCSKLGRLRWPFARPSEVESTEIVKIHTYWTDSQMGQTQIWDRLRYGTDSQLHISF